MVEESSPLLPLTAESVEAESDAAVETKTEAEECAPAAEPDFLCNCEEWMRSACKGLLFYGPHKSQRYCVLHYPRKVKRPDFRKALWEKLAANDFNFCGVWFPEYLDLGNREIDVKVDFRSATFKGHTDFCDTKFLQGADFSDARFDATADFLEATFSSGKANFASASFKAAVDFIRAKFLSDADFTRAKFAQEANFDGARFFNAQLGDAELGTANFSSAKFGSTARFESARFVCNADFGSARFEAEADFKEACFVGAQFSHAEFSAHADFSGATFLQLANFFSTTFASNTDFLRTVFHKVGFFSRAVFNDAVSFSASAHDRTLADGSHIKERTLGDNSSLDFQYARFESPERVSFHTVTLRPHWFVNVDPRKFVFTNVDWRHPALEQEVNALEARSVASPHQAMAIAYRQIAINAEENHRYDEASSFRYWSMAVRRQERWYRFRLWRLWKRALSGPWSRLNERQSVRFLRQDAFIHWVYWAVSGYSERMLRPFLWLLGIWIVFAVLYMQVGFTRPDMKSTMKGEAVATSPDYVGEPLQLERAFTYSLGVMSLQKPEPRPLTSWAHALVTLETILGPVQGALLALAIRRRFMR